MPAERIAVAAGVIVGADRRILLAQRGAGANHAGKWEFPGGKIESGEGDAQALCRELEEELGIVVGNSEPLITFDYDYPERSVRLYVRTVTAYTGDPVGREGQLLRWVATQDLGGIDLLAANTPIVRAVQLPRHYAISDMSRFGEPKTVERLRKWTSGQPPLFQLREKDLPLPRLRALAQSFQAACTGTGIRILVNGEPELAVELGLDGVHLPAAQLMTLGTRPVGHEYLLGVSCHNAEELHQAARIAADFAVLSPVRATSSHPDTAGLGWDTFEHLCAAAGLPVYALGGMRLHDDEQARRRGGQGVAMISAAWS